MQIKHLIGILVGVGLVMSIPNACTHDPIVIEDVDPDMNDTTIVPPDTMVVDTNTIDTTGMPCDPDVVYFQRDILPIFLGNCAFSGCHDVTTASDGVILDNYDNIVSTGKVKAFDLNESEVYEAITEDNPDKIMPPGNPLDNSSIQLIAKWILQGAKNLECDEEGCNTTDITYSKYIQPLMAQSCNGCHATAIASGGVVTDNYSSVKSLVSSGEFYGSIAWLDGYIRMPFGQGQLDSCDILKVKTWIDEGAQDN